MTIGDFDGTPLVAEAILTGSWTVDTLNHVDFVHVTSDIYALAFSDQGGSDKQVYLATVRVTGAGVITAATLDLFTFSLTNDQCSGIDLHKLSDGVVAVFFGLIVDTPGLQLSTFSIDGTTGAITLLDGPDTLLSGDLDGPPRALRTSSGTWGVIFVQNNPDTPTFLTVSLSDSGTIGAVLDGEDTFTANGNNVEWLQLDQDVAIRFSGNTESLIDTFALNSGTGIFSLTSLDSLAAGGPQQPRWVGHVDPDNLAARQVYSLGTLLDELAHFTINASDEITRDDSINISAGIFDATRFPSALVIGERKLFFMGGGTTDAANVYVSTASGTLSQYSSEGSLGFADGTMRMEDHHPVYLEGSEDTKIVVGFLDRINDNLMVAVIGIQVDLDVGIPAAQTFGTIIIG